MSLESQTGPLPSEPAVVSRAVRNGFGKQRQKKKNTPVILFDEEKNAIMWQCYEGGENKEVDISKLEIGLLTETFCWGWFAYVQGKGLVQENVRLVCEGDMLDPPKLPAGKYKNGKPAQWERYAEMQCVVDDDSNQLCVFRITDHLTLEAIDDILQPHRNQIVVRFVGSRMVDGHRQPIFKVLP